MSNFRALLLLTGALALATAYQTACTVGLGDLSSSEENPILSGCGQLDEFTRSARVVLRDHCGTCHADEIDSAIVALNTSRIRDLSPSGQEFSCAEALRSVDLVDPMGSVLLTANDPAVGDEHPFKFEPDEFTEFRDDLRSWLETEAGPAQ